MTRDDVNDVSKLSQDELQLALHERALAVRKAREHLIDFTRVTLPHADAPDWDYTRSEYTVRPVHQLIANALERVYLGLCLRLVIEVQPRIGKSELTSRRFPAYVLGRDPGLHGIFATYNADFAGDFGREVRDILQSPRYGEIFPGTVLAEGSKSAERLRTTRGGGFHFIGRGGGATGRGAHIGIIDDPFKDDEEVESAAIRQKAWRWFTKVFMTRQMSKTAAVIIIMTRWHEDDIVGRLLEPSNPMYDEQIARGWERIRIPAEAEHDDPLGRERGDVLWPDKFPIEFLHAQKRLDPVGYAALYQQRPSPEDGDYFLREYIRPYRPQDLPEGLTIYAASDHAVGTDKNKHDATVLLIAGVDRHGVVWLLDCWWDRKPTNVVIEQMIDMMDHWKPVVWWAEKGHISKSIGPFLRKRMSEREVFCAVHEVTPAANKQQRAQAIRGRMAMGMVRFPRGATWYGEALEELLKFPNGSHDDFVDTIAYIGLGLPQLTRGGGPKGEKKEAKVGTLGWLKKQAAAEAEARAEYEQASGW